MISHIINLHKSELNANGKRKDKPNYESLTSTSSSTITTAEKHATEPSKSRESDNINNKFKPKRSCTITTTVVAPTVNNAAQELSELTRRSEEESTTNLISSSNHISSDIEFEEYEPTPKQKRFSCHTCKLNFATYSQRSEHEALLNHGKYFCDKCRKGFALKNTFRYHGCQRKSQGSKVCPFCQHQYKYDLPYQKHIKNCAS